VSGALIYFALTTSNGSIDRSELTTDGNGAASILYYAWNNFAEDILLAWTEGSGYSQLVIPKTGQLLGYTAKMTATPSEFKKGTGGGPWLANTVLTVTVVDNNNLPAPGLRVRINPDLAIFATPDDALTGVDGKATFIYLEPLGLGTVVVDAYVDVNDNGVQDPADPTTGTTITMTE
jgi:hypothetical protein